MKNIILLIALHTICLLAAAQYTLRGEVKNEDSTSLRGVLVYVFSSGASYRTNSEGQFEATVNFPNDTVSFSLAGYRTIRLTLPAGPELHICLRKDADAKKNRLTNTINRQQSYESLLSYGGETYSSLMENPFIATSYSHTISFTVNTNRASYSNIRRFINLNTRVPGDAVRIEEMLNYFNFNYSKPKENEVFEIGSAVSACPWNSRHQLLFASVSARTVNLQTVAPGNFVFLIDVSGSMDLPNKLPLIKSGLRLLIKNLRPIDTVSLVAYGSAVAIVLEGVPGSDKDQLNRAVESLSAQGGTPGEAGLKMAYAVARRRLIKGGNNRIILATDGDFNVGVSSEKELQELIVQQGESGIHLTCLGVGMGNYKDSKLSVLALKGHGNFAYIDNEQEAEKVFVTELTQTLFAVAENVYLTVDFDSSLVKEFRLIGYDNKRKALSDSLSELEGGEIGSGHSLMAIFELDTWPGIRPDSRFAGITIHYQLPGEDEPLEKQSACHYHFVPYKKLDTSLQKATNIVMLGMKLRQSPNAKNIRWNLIELPAQKIFSADNPLDRQYLELLKKARKIYKKSGRDD